MSLHFHPLTVKSVRKETADCVSIEFEVPATLQQTFAYKQGQNIAIKTQINGQEIRRNYSICTSTQENRLRVAVKKMEGGLFSTYANDTLKKGEVLEVFPPTGKFYTELDPTQHKNYLAVAAGSGITPVLSLIKTTLATEPASSFTLVYGNRTRHSILFFEELENLKNQYMQRFNLVHVLSREKTESLLNFGRIDQVKLMALSKLIAFSAMDEIFICGPREMIETTKEYLLAAGVEKKNIHVELFNAGTATQSSSKGTSSHQSVVKSKIQIQLDGRQVEIEIPLHSDKTILDAALEQGADLPFACKGGVCCTCKARVMEGKVTMDANYSLSEEEVADGFILELL